MSGIRLHNKCVRKETLHFRTGDVPCLLVYILRIWSQNCGLSSCLVLEFLSVYNNEVEQQSTLIYVYHCKTGNKLEAHKTFVTVNFMVYERSFSMNKYVIGNK